jgi:WXG100 family type VII secretion target
MSNVQAVTEEMSRIGRQINKILDDLETESGAHLAQWTSNARDAYNAAKIQWNLAADDMVIQADNARNALSQITDSYANAEFQGLGLWGN